MSTDVCLQKIWKHFTLHWFCKSRKQYFTVRFAESGILLVQWNVAWKIRREHKKIFNWWEYTFHPYKIVPTTPQGNVVHYSSSAFPSYISGVHHFGWDFCECGRIEVVTFSIRGWCTLGMFLLPVFARLGHECQDRLSPCDGMHVCTD